jgi:hypothetical protein
LAKLGNKAIQLDESDFRLGVVEPHNDARKCAEFIKKHADEIDGVLVCQPTSGTKDVVESRYQSVHLNPRNDSDGEFFSHYLRAHQSVSELSVLRSHRAECYARGALRLAWVGGKSYLRAGGCA